MIVTYIMNPKCMNLKKEIGGITMNHLLVKKAFIYENKKVENLDNCAYKNLLGAWVLGTNNQFLVKSDTSNRPKFGTKKCDIETGEDQKGE